MSFIKATAGWVHRNWTELIPKIGALILESEGIALSEKGYNDLLVGFMTEQLELWLFTKDDAIIGYVMTSYGLGGPVGNTACYIRQLRAIEPIVFENWQKAFETLKKRARERNCSHIIATTQSENVEKLAESLGAYKDTRLIWSTNDG